MSSSSKRLTLAAVGLLIVVVGVVALVTNRSSNSSSAAGTDPTTDTSKPPLGFDDPNDTTPVDPNATTTSEPYVVPPTTQPAVIPLNITVSSTSGLHDADPVTFHITPDAGANVYGAEAFLCAPETTFTLDADIRPSIAGKCITKRLSPNSLDYLNKAVAPPYQSLDLSFPVGVGTDQFTTQDGRNITITCGPGHPCTLVLKLQFSHGFGFKAYPLTYQ